MPKVEDFKDLNIRWVNHPKYKSDKPIENELIEVIVQKLEMILYTNSDEILGNPDIGINLEYWLWKTSISNDMLKNKIIKQINRYIPELNIIGYEIELKIFEGDYRDILELNFVVHGYNIYYVFQ